MTSLVCRSTIHTVPNIPDGQQLDTQPSQGWLLPSLKRAKSLETLPVPPYDHDNSQEARLKRSSNDNECRLSSRVSNETHARTPIAIDHRPNEIYAETHRPVPVPASESDKYEILPRVTPLKLSNLATYPHDKLDTAPREKAVVTSRVEEMSTATSMEASEVSLRNPLPNPGLFVGLQNQDSRISDSSMTTWRQIQKLRVDVWSLRSQIHEIRAKLRAKQNAKSVAEDMLFKRISTQQLLDPITNQKPESSAEEEKTIAELRQELQDARDEYGPLEDECNFLEDQLSGEEFRLARTEEDFYRRPGEHPPEYAEDSVNPAFRSLSPAPMASLRELESMDTHPLVFEFHSKLGDLDLLRERHGDLLDEKEALEQEKDSRKRVQLTLGTEDQEWLDNFVKVEAELLKEIRLVEADVVALRQRCLNDGLVDENDEPTDFESQERVSFRSDDVKSEGRISEYVKYPLLLPHPSLKSEQLAGFDPKPNDKSDDTANRINHWLLQQLRTSALEVRLLASTFEGKGGKLNDRDRWQLFVLDYWYKDDTIVSKRNYPYSSSLSTHANPRSKDSEHYHF